MFLCYWVFLCCGMEQVYLVYGFGEKLSTSGLQSILTIRLLTLFIGRVFIWKKHILFKTKRYYKFTHIYQSCKHSLSSISIMPYNYSLCTGLSYDESWYLIYCFWESVIFQVFWSEKLWKCFWQNHRYFQ